MIEYINKKFNSLSGNNKIVVINVLGALLIKGLSLIVSLFSTPAYIHFFNNEVTLGIWFTILSVVSWILNFDLGIGNGLRNHLTKSYTEKKYIESRCLISSAYVSIGALCLFIIILFLGVSKQTNWNAFFNVQEEVISADSLNKAVQIIFIGIMLQMFFKIISSVLYAIQKSSINNLLTLLTAVILLVAIVIIPSKDNNHNIIIMALIYDVAVLLPYIVATALVFFNKKYRRISPTLRSFKFKYSKKVLSLGGLFFLVQLLYMLIMSTNEYFITAFDKSNSVVEYKIYNQIFTLGSTMFALALTPIWSAVTKAITEQDFKWVNKLYKKLLLLSTIGIAVEFSIVPFLQIIINLWLGNAAFYVSYGYAVCFAALGSLMIFNCVLSSVANGIGKLKTQLIIFGIGATTKIPLSLILIEQFNSWIGVVVATNFALLIYCIVQPITIRKYIIEHQ